MPHTKESQRSRSLQPSSRTSTTKRSEPQSKAKQVSRSQQSKYLKYQQDLITNTCQHSELALVSRPKQSSPKSRSPPNTVDPPSNSTYQQLLDVRESYRRDQKEFDDLFDKFKKGPISRNDQATIARLALNSLQGLRQTLRPALDGIPTSERCTRRSAAVVKRVLEVTELLETILGFC